MRGIEAVLEPVISGITRAGKKYAQRAFKFYRRFSGIAVVFRRAKIARASLSLANTRARDRPGAFA